MSSDMTKIISDEEMMDLIKTRITPPMVFKDRSELYKTLGLITFNTDIHISRFVTLTTDPKSEGVSVTEVYDTPLPETVEEYPNTVGKYDILSMTQEEILDMILSSGITPEENFFPFSFTDHIQVFKALNIKHDPNEELFLSMAKFRKLLERYLDYQVGGYVLNPILTDYEKDPTHNQKKGVCTKKSPSSRPGLFEEYLYNPSTEVIKVYTIHEVNLAHYGKILIKEYSKDDQRDILGFVSVRGSNPLYRLIESETGKQSPRWHLMEMLFEPDIRPFFGFTNERYWTNWRKDLPGADVLDDSSKVLYWYVIDCNHLGDDLFAPLDVTLKFAKRLHSVHISRTAIRLERRCNKYGEKANEINYFGKPEPDDWGIDYIQEEDEDGTQHVSWSVRWGVS